jgi:hypothetical protein
MTVDIDISQLFEDNILIKYGKFKKNSEMMSNMPLIDIICISIRKLKENYSKELE